VINMGVEVNLVPGFRESDLKFSDVPHPDMHPSQSDAVDIFIPNPALYGFFPIPAKHPLPAEVIGAPAE
jgi:hypothetical protein